MTNVRERVHKELDDLLEQGKQLVKDLGATKDATNFKRDYQGWYTRALAVIKQLIPERLTEFTSLYYDKDVRYHIARYLRGAYSTYTARDARVGAHNRFLQQCLILESAQSSLDDILTNIHGVVQAEILDSELDAATELLRAGHIRSANLSKAPYPLRNRILNRPDGDFKLVLRWPRSRSDRVLRKGAYGRVCPT